MENKRKYYLLDDGQVTTTDDLMAWAQWFETADRRVAVTQVGEYEVSTVFLGIDHNFSGDGEPVLYETMVFLDGHGTDSERYTTREEAIVGHNRMVKRVQGG